VCESAERASSIQGVVDRFGRIDVLLNNAGVGYVEAVSDMTAEDVERIIADPGGVVEQETSADRAQRTCG
jgi:NADP-dependent 3-hydroxy acid dehydrogenase YdfG